MGKVASQAFINEMRIKKNKIKHSYYEGGLKSSLVNP